MATFWEETSKMYLCLRDDRLEECREMLLAGMDPDMTFKLNGNLKPAINVAVERNSPQVVELLLKGGGTVDIRDSDGRTALLVSLAFKYEKISVLLLRHRANPNLHDKNGHSPLHLSVQSKSDAITKLLIELGANVSTRDRDGRTPLMWVGQFLNDRLELMKLLLNNGAKADAVDNCGLSVLDHIMSSYNCTAAMIELLLQKGARLGKKERSEYIYRVLAQHNFSLNTVEKCKTLEVLLKYGCDANSNFIGQKLLYWAVASLDSRAIRILLKHGADPNALNSLGVSPFHKAFSNVVEGVDIRFIVFIFVNGGGRLTKRQLESGFPFPNFTKEENEFLFRKMTNPMTLKEQSRIATWKAIGSRTYDWENLKDQIPEVLYQYLQLVDRNIN